MVNLCARTYFYPRPPCGGRPIFPKDGLYHSLFLSTSPLRGTTTGSLRRIRKSFKFLSTSPLRGTTGGVPFQRHVDLHFYPRPPCGGRPNFGCGIHAERLISIHVPLAGDDSLSLSICAAILGFLSTSPLRGTTLVFSSRSALVVISIHVPLAGDDLDAPKISVSVTTFLSTSPLRGTTPCSCPLLVSLLFLSTSPLRGTTISAGPPGTAPAISIHVPLAGDDDALQLPVVGELVISIHVPLAGDDRDCMQRIRHVCISIHVPLAGDDSAGRRLSQSPPNISIHVPLAGDDPACGPLGAAGTYFYPRPPCGGRHPAKSRPSRCLHFYPRPPCGGRLRAVPDKVYVVDISIHVPLAGDDLGLRAVVLVERISIHVPLAGDDGLRQQRIFYDK